MRAEGVSPCQRPERSTYTFDHLRRSVGVHAAGIILQDLPSRRRRRRRGNRGRRSGTVKEPIEISSSDLGFLSEIQHARQFHQVTSQQAIKPSGWTLVTWVEGPDRHAESDTDSTSRTCLSALSFSLNKAEAISNT